MRHKHGDHEHDHDDDHQHGPDGGSHAHNGHLPDFHDFLPPPTHPRIAPLLGRDARQHGEAGLNNPFLRELIIPFGASGYVALFEIDNRDCVTFLAVRHQREEDYH